MNIVSEILDAIPDAAAPTIVWGQVTGVSPTKVRFAGDTSGDIEVSLRLSAYTPTTTDKVLLLKVGTQWVIIGKVTT